MYIYIYIYTYRERDTHTHIHIYIYVRALGRAPPPLSAAPFSSVASEMVNGAWREIWA